jgi:uncharacterized protein (TIGR03067 family)
VYRAAVLLLFLPTTLAAGEGLSTLQGEWRLASTADENREYPGSRLLHMAVTEGGSVRFLLGGAETNSGTFTTAKAAGKLKAIDLKLADEKVLRGVYALDGAALVMCFAEAGKPRPAALKPRGTEWAERWERAGKQKRPGPGSCTQPVTEQTGGP